jgi:hypothetical protein
MDGQKTSAMWETSTALEDGGRIRKHVVQRDGAAISYADAVSAWRDDAAFRDVLIALLAVWETPAITVPTMSRPFEFVLVDSPALAGRAAERRAFEAQFRTEGDAEGVAAFDNLGGDAFLVAPCPLAPDSCYAHIAAFSRGAPAEQQHALWRRVGESIARRVSTKPLWVSTSGLGVIWLHVRLDSRPKYYSYQPYRRGAP